VVSHHIGVELRSTSGVRFQSPDGDSVVSHISRTMRMASTIAACFSPLTGIPWFPTEPASEPADKKIEPVSVP